METPTSYGAIAVVQFKVPNSDLKLHDGYDTVQRWMYANSLVYHCVIKVDTLNDWSLHEVTQLRGFHLSPLRCDRTLKTQIYVEGERRENNYTLMMCPLWINFNLMLIDF